MARWLGAAFGIVMVGVVWDILVTENVIVGQYIVPYSFVGFILLQSGILSGRTAQAHRRVEHLSDNLKEEVEAQTKALHSKTLEALDQGGHPWMKKVVVRAC